MLTWMEDSRPRKLTLGVEFRLQSDFQVKNTQILHLKLKKNIQNTPVMIYVLISFDVLTLSTNCCNIQTSILMNLILVKFVVV